MISTPHFKDAREPDSHVKLKSRYTRDAKETHEPGILNAGTCIPTPTYSIGLCVMIFVGTINILPV
ncbi:hypothetical protein P153DRAFT_370934 [Dothidotthia symphoricarpi CBS 119687]|uniref:Uncharacterized protein n=1 Tax=Dothidotthia symphoricarpi CBS 119687 TaxID=1392245 RepID=A0A6A6A046_9PLEO|nr:uncharacterized protein P153DRAFT_370934 [Dothidotthia symphoricarpi CBS 119687]KAF2124534.1 hypothetical protein P153DRAFT_370934 [Dothidotthia symphoricarpi CBS 119687]